MINTLPRASFMISGALALSACVSAPQYETTSTAGVATSNLGGAALNLVGTSGAPQRIMPLTATMNRAAGSFSLDDGTYLFLDVDGFDASGRITDGTNLGFRLDGPGVGAFTNGYDYVIPIQYRYTVGGVASVYTGSVGIETHGADIPTAGIAHYTGEAIAGFEPPAGSSISLNNGTSVVDVNFGSGKVDVTLGFVTTAAFDAIAGTGMQMVGSSFFGGTWRTYKNGIVVDMFGLGTTSTSMGDFYGYDATISGPDEVAGVVLMSGLNGAVYGMYLAD